MSPIDKRNLAGVLFDLNCREEARHKSTYADYNKEVTATIAITPRTLYYLTMAAEEILYGPTYHSESSSNNSGSSDVAPMDTKEKG